MEEELNNPEVYKEPSKEDRKLTLKNRAAIVVAVLDALLFAVIIYEVVSMFIS